MRPTTASNSVSAVSKLDGSASTARLSSVLSSGCAPPSSSASALGCALLAPFGTRSGVGGIASRGDGTSDGGGKSLGLAKISGWLFGRSGLDIEGRAKKCKNNALPAGGAIVCFRDCTPQLGKRRCRILQLPPLMYCSVVDAAR